jgi:disulfide oxidoreductase YuzD
MLTQNSKQNLYSRGSNWRKWDLHFHTPGIYDYEDKSVTNEEIIEALKKEEIRAVAITDHHFIDVQRIKKLKEIAGSDVVIFPGVEFCSSSRGKEPIHFIGIFPEYCDIEYVWNEINSKSDIAKKKREGKKDDEIYCDLEKTSKLIKELGGVVSIHAGKKSNSIEKITNSLPVTMAEKEDISKHIDIFELGQEKDQKDYVEKVFPKIGMHPLVICSDNHNAKKYRLKQFCWIKADPTFEGLKQILYEPEPGERVWIGPTEPDQKDDYKIIWKIKFENTNDFPEEIEFNKNLCSIIGSRSSGKSALLAYLADSINPEYAEEQNPKGPGDGFPWSKVNFNYSVEWNNGLSNSKSPGEIVYIPQNHLFEKSQDPDEIKKKIEPVLFKVIPDFAIKYKQAENNINTHNQKISGQVESWFQLADLIRSLEEKLKGLGDKKAIEKEKAAIESKISRLREKNQLSEEDVKNYQKISANISEYEARIKQIDTELPQIADISEEQGFFDALSLVLTPPLENLPKKLQNAISESLQEEKATILAKINNQVIDYKKSIEKEKTEVNEKISKIKTENNVLIIKYQKNIELEELVKKLNEYNGLINKIEDMEEDKRQTQKELKSCERAIKGEIDQRKSLIDGLRSIVDSADQSSIEGIKFGLEYGFDNNLLEIVTQKMNVREASEFVERHALNIDYIRGKPDDFLSAIYSGKQKINVGNSKKETARVILSLTEKVLFTAEMEGDKIGGFSVSTMTPGKRAFFALRLILAESEDAWPLLIDQPEDDLDSSSICDEIVPFLKEKKKERQIIMVSHNANLVIGADSEQIIAANRDGSDRKNEDGKLFNYLTGSIEYTKEKEEGCVDTLKAQGIREHACKILDGGKDAFELRRNKYNLAKT